MGNKTESHGKLKQRHVSMISIAGIIGAGLFVGSGSVINATGPANSSFICSQLLGLLVVLLMRTVLGEYGYGKPR